MPRYEITGTATDRFTLEEIQYALRASGAVNVRSRHAFGWSNQPKVATFTARNDAEARGICFDAQLYYLPGGMLPALLPYEIKV